jgi:hypothetical protein
MICKIKRTRYNSVDRRSTIYASEINCGAEWPEAFEVENLNGMKSVYPLAEATDAYARYRSPNDEHILVLKD